MGRYSDRDDYRDRGYDRRGDYGRDRYDQDFRSGNYRSGSSDRDFGRSYDESRSRYDRDFSRNRYDQDFGGRSYGRDYGDERRGYGRRHDDDRGFIERAGDEVRSWFGDDEAERRREMDERRRERDDRARGYRGDFNREYDRSDYRSDYGGYGAGGGIYDQVAEGGPYGDYNRRSSGSEEWRGPHTGRGPKGYQRSREQIREGVCEGLTRHGDIDASDIEINVDENGEVTLTGAVDSRRTKRLAESVAESVTGVRDVHNRLTIKREDAGAQTGGAGASTGSTSMGAGRTSQSTEQSAMQKK